MAKPVGVTTRLLNAVLTEGRGGRRTLGGIFERLPSTGSGQHWPSAMT
jgi:hypothetical protein